MKIHEYQAEALLRSYGVPCPEGYPAFSVEEAVEVSRRLPEGAKVVKAQVHSGGRGKAGGVKLAWNEAELRAAAEQIYGMRLVTKQTGPEGRVVRRLLVCEALDISREYYLSFTQDAARGQAVMIASADGGMEIEEIARTAPERIHRCDISPDIGLRGYQCTQMANELGLRPGEAKQFCEIARALYRLFGEKDCSLVEINPLVVTGDGRMMASDAKLNFDDNALMRHPEIRELRDPDEEDPREVEAAKYDLNYVQLDGNIGCLVNGAGLAMATMDLIQAWGGRPANFLDVSGSATEEKVAGAFRILLSDSNVRGILVNIFGGIMRCDVIAAGIVAAARQVKANVPLVVRLAGTNAERGGEILRASGLDITPADDLADAARKVCVLAVEGRKDS